MNINKASIERIMVATESYRRLFEEKLAKRIESKSSRDQRRERVSAEGPFPQSAVDVQYEQELSVWLCPQTRYTFY